MRRQSLWRSLRISREKTTQPRSFGSGAYFYIDKIKAGASVIDGKPLMSIGYEQGRFEALAHFDGGRYKGATVMYNVAEW